MTFPAWAILVCLSAPQTEPRRTGSRAPADQPTERRAASPAAPGVGAREAPRPSPLAALRIVFWYDRDRPLDTFRYRVYDLRKNEFTPEVERWLADVRARFPRFEAYTRDVILSRE